MKRMFNKIVNSGTKIRCEGLNLIKIINLCISKGIVLEDLTKHSSTCIEFYLNDYNLNRFKKLDLSNHVVKIEKIGGIKAILNNILKRIGLIVGLALSIILLIILQNRLFYIEVYGLTSIDKESVVNSIEEFGLKKLSLMNFDKSSLENYLTQKFDFSLVSVVTKGNTLLISIKEELPDITENFEPIVADFNMVITSINVYAGTTKYKVGDVVYKGDILVESYIMQGEERVDIKACAEITGDTFFTSKYEFKNEEVVFARSGKSKIIDNNYYLGKIKLFGSNSDNPYTNYEVENYESVISSYFLPIKVNKIIAYELVETKVTRDFEQEKNTIIEELKKQAYLQIPSHMIVDNEEVIVSEILGGYMINVYLKSEVQIKIL